MEGMDNSASNRQSLTKVFMVTVFFVIFFLKQQQQKRIKFLER